MDVFARTFHQAADAGSASPAANRHMTIFRSCVDQDDAAVLVARCAKPALFSAGVSYLMLTQRRLVVIQEMWPLHRPRLHLNANLRHLDNVSWQVSRSGVELALTAMDGVRERFRLRVGSLETVEDLFRRMFHGRRIEPVAPAPRRVASLAFS